MCYLLGGGIDRGLSGSRAEAEYSRPFHGQDKEVDETVGDAGHGSELESGRSRSSVGGFELSGSTESNPESTSEMTSSSDADPKPRR